MKWKHIPNGSYLLSAVIVLTGLTVLILDSLSWFSPQHYSEEGKKAMDNENYVKAIRELSKAQSYCETDIYARFSLGAAYQNYGWYDEALRQYHSTWHLAMINGGRAQHNSGRIWRQKGNPQKAITCYRRALTLLPLADDIWFDLGLSLNKLNKHQSALAAFREAVRLNPENKYYHDTLEALHKQLNNTQPAKK